MALIFRSDVAMTDPGDAPRVARNVVNPGALRRFLPDALPLEVGDLVTSIPDLAGSGVPLNAHAGNADNAPTLRRSDAITYMEFDGINDRLNSGSSSPVQNQPITVMVVGRFRSLAAAVPIINLHTNASGRHIGVHGTGFITGAFGSSVVSTIPADTGWHVFTMIANGASSILAQDDVEQTVNLGTAASSSITLGRDTAGTGYAQINVGEILIFPTALTPGQRAAERESMRAFYRIT